MDPTETLARIREIIHKENSGEFKYAEDCVGPFVDLVELIDALDVWLSNGGMNPNAWVRR